MFTYFSLETPKRVTNKQCRARADIAECSICTGSPLFTNNLAFFSLGISKLHYLTHLKLRPASVARLDALSNWRPGGRRFNPRRSRQHSFVEIDHEIFSTVILSLPLIQERHLSDSSERMCTILVNRLED